jgi:hypothetical protein
MVAKLKPIHDVRSWPDSPTQSDHANPAFHHHHDHSVSNLGSSHRAGRPHFVGVALPPRGFELPPPREPPPPSRASARAPTVLAYGQLSKLERAQRAARRGMEGWRASKQRSAAALVEALARPVPRRLLLPHIPRKLQVQVRWDRFGVQSL